MEEKERIGSKPLRKDSCLQPWVEISRYQSDCLRGLFDRFSARRALLPS